jgi:hypothetical protein
MICQRNIPELTNRADPCVIDPHINASKRINGLLRESLHFILLADITVYRQRAATRRFTLLRKIIEQFIAPRRKDDGRPCTSKFQGSPFAKAA